MNQKIRILFVIACGVILTSSSAVSQTISGVINSYYEVTGISGGCGLCNAACSPSFTLSTVTGLAAGDRVLIIQMQASASGIINNGSAYQFSPDYGLVSNTGGAGNYEFATINSVAGSAVTFTKPLINTYDVIGKVQLVKVPVFGNVSTSGNVTGNAWNGTTGGVLVLECSGTLNMGHNFSMNNLGFRGGAQRNLTACCNTGVMGALNGAYYFDETQSTSGCGGLANQGNFGASKGEGIFRLMTNQMVGRGAFANAGGGGSGHNGGGGGGGNGTAGGRGGHEYYSCADRVADDMGGYGGYAVNASCNMLVMGGGGGAGHTDNGNPNARGGNGGGIIIIKANTINVTSGSITSNGETCGNTFSDGAGGGGAGGTIFLSIDNYAGSPLLVEANGGNGGNHAGGGGFCHAPGGGGGAGTIAVSGTLPKPGVTFNLNGGVNGTNTVSGACGAMSAAAATNTAACDGLTLTENFCPLPVEWLRFEVEIIESNALITWITLTEKNNDYFLIEKSEDGISWKELTIIPGVGTSNEKTAYSFIDKHTAIGNNYYRLKQVDFDGSFQFSEVKSTYRSSYVQSVNIYHGILSSDVQLSLFNSGTENNVEVMVYDMMGKRLLRTTFELEAGENRRSINLSMLPFGIYIIEVLSPSVEIKKTDHIGDHR